MFCCVMSYYTVYTSIVVYISILYWINNTLYTYACYLDVNKHIYIYTPIHSHILGDASTDSFLWAELIHGIAIKYDIYGYLSSPMVRASHDVLILLSTYHRGIVVRISHMTWFGVKSVKSSLYPKKPVRSACQGSPWPMPISRRRRALGPRDGPWWKGPGDSDFILIQPGVGIDVPW